MWVHPSPPRWRISYIKYLDLLTDYRPWRTKLSDTYSTQGKFPQHGLEHAFYFIDEISIYLGIIRRKFNRTDGTSVEFLSC